MPDNRPARGGGRVNSTIVHGFKLLSQEEPDVEHTIDS